MNVSLFELFSRGGIVMWAILLCSIAALALSVERLLTITRFELETADLNEQVNPPMRIQEWGEVSAVCKRFDVPLARIYTTILGLRNLNRAQLQEQADRATAKEIRTLEKYVPLLGTIAHMTPLLGLLGTVTGLVKCFQVIQEKATTLNPVHPGDLAGGIWESLLTTVFGLLVAIPAYAMYNYLAHRIEGYLFNIQNDASEMIEKAIEIKREEPKPQAITF